jgi:gas vesicle protein
MIDEVKGIIAEVETNYQEIAKSFGDDPKKMDTAQWLAGITGFIQGIVRAKQENIQREIEKSKAAKKQADPAGKDKKPEIHHLVSESAERGILDELEKKFATGLRRVNPR